MASALIKVGLAAGIVVEAVLVDTDEEVDIATELEASDDAGPSALIFVNTGDSEADIVIEVQVELGVASAPSADEVELMGAAVCAVPATLVGRGAKLDATHVPESVLEVEVGATLRLELDGPAAAMLASISLAADQVAVGAGCAIADCEEVGPEYDIAELALIAAFESKARFLLSSSSLSSEAAITSVCVEASAAAGVKTRVTSFAPDIGAVELAAGEAGGTAAVEFTESRCESNPIFLANIPALVAPASSSCASDVVSA